MSTHGTQAIDRAAHLLARVIQADAAPTFTELCAESGYARSTTSRLLAALERSDLLRRLDDGGWEPGPLFEQYAARTDTKERIAKAARPVMERLSELTGETINLGVAVGRGVVQIAQVDSKYFLGSRDWVGVDLPAHTSALGKVLYAHGVIPRGRGSLERCTEHTLASWTQLLAQFDAIRSGGFACTVDELEIGLTGIAAPVHNDGSVVAAVGLSGPTTRLAGRIPEFGEMVADQAAVLSDLLN